MTETERLRELLTERGAKLDGCILMGAPITFWGEQERDGRWPYRYWEHDGWASFSADPKSDLFTPEQAVEATLGCGECELINAADDLGKGTSSCMCSECGYTALDDLWDEFKYCPNCGRKVVEK